MAPLAVRFALDDAQSRDVAASRRGRRAPSHARTTADQACLDALAALLRGDKAAASRCLARLDPQLLSSRLLPAVQEFGRAAAAVLASGQPAAAALARSAGAGPGPQPRRRAGRLGRTGRLNDSGPDSAA